MKSRRMPLVWMVSFLLHACFAVVIGYIAISSKQLKAQDAIDVSFFIVTPPQAAKRDVIAKPAVVATPVPDLRVVPQTETTPRRTTLARAARSSATAAPAASLTAGAPAAPRGQQVKVSSTSPVLQHTEQSLSTAANLPTTSDALPTAGLSSGGITDGLSAGVGDGLGSGTGRGSFGSGSGLGQGRTQGGGKLNALVEGAGVANISASLSDVEENMVLGNGVPQLPKGSPGAIIQGRGKEIIGSLHLVRLDDPLHPNLDFWGSGIGHLRFGAGLPYLVKSLNAETGIQTQMVDAVQITDAAFFESPIIFMEPIARSSLPLKNGLLNGSAIWQTQGDRPSFGYTDREAQRIREYVINRGGFIYMPTHGNTEAAMQPALRVLRQILPEYNLTIIPQDHEIYNSYYELNGPLRFPIRKMGSTILHHGPYSQLRGVFIDDRLAVLVDTEAMIHVMDGAVQKPFFGHYKDRNKILDEFAPAAARQLVNIVIYAVTHGNISDYSNYIPADALAGGQMDNIPKQAPAAANQL